jgi:hypothetical protein
MVDFFHYTLKANVMESFDHALLFHYARCVRSTIHRSFE